MKKVFTTIIILFLISSCEKFTFQPIPEDPLWLEEKISEIKAGTNFGYKIDVYLWNGEYYYHINSIISSCFFCNFYTYEGERYAWRASEMEDFFANSFFVGTAWSSPPYSKS